MRTLLIEDQPVWADVLIDMLRSRVPEVEPIIVARVDEALRLLGRGRPDLVLADLSTDDVGSAVEGIVEQSRGARVIALDNRIRPENVRRAREAAVKGYIAKTLTRPLIDAAIGLVLAGGEYFPRVEQKGPIVGRRTQLGEPPLSPPVSGAGTDDERQGQPRHLRVAGHIAGDGEASRACDPARRRSAQSHRSGIESARPATQLRSLASGSACRSPTQCSASKAPWTFPIPK